MSIEKFVEDQLNKAIAKGEFDNLPGRGKPVDLEGYFRTPEDLRLCYSMLKNADFVPEEVQMLKDIEALREWLAASKDEAEKARLGKVINEKLLTINMAMERYRRRR